MGPEHGDFWFPAKAYGFGWGLPVRWQGWLVLVGYLLLLVAGIVYFHALHAPLGRVLYVALISVLLLVVIYLKGERPVRWRWRGK